jgi:hypothetical protein
MMYVYIQSEPELWTVGFYKPDGTWFAESDHGSDDDAANRVHWLNGGALMTAVPVPMPTPTPSTYLCTVCHKNPVDADAGIDTCRSCSRRM